MFKTRIERESFHQVRLAHHHERHGIDALMAIYQNGERDLGLGSFDPPDKLGFEVMDA